jgi:folate-dependent phosphoribosylglycinamide formyltransferase PurN
MLNIGWFSTGRGPGSQGLLRFVQDRLEQGLLDARIQFVFSNREPGEAEGSDQLFELARNYGLNVATLSSSKFRREMGGRFADHRTEYDGRVMKLLSGYQPDICVLAGYMLIIGGPMCRQYPLLNLHPALPDGPIGTWQEVVWRLIENRTDRTGAMIHLATEEVDRGPLISYCTVPLTGPQIDEQWLAAEKHDLDKVKGEVGEEFTLFQMIRQAEYEREPYLLFETLRAVADGRVSIRDGQVFYEATPGGSETGAFPGVCLDPEIQRAMADDSEAGAA